MQSPFIPFLINIYIHSLCLLQIPYVDGKPNVKEFRVFKAGDLINFKDTELSDPSSFLRYTLLIYIYTLTHFSVA